jgi:hypothetical protein
LAIGLGLGRRQNSGVTNPAQDAILPHCLGRMPGDPANSNKASQKKGRAVTAVFPVFIPL